MLCNGIICYENFGAGFFHSVTLWEFTQVAVCIGLPGGVVVKNTSANAGNARDSGSIPGLGRSPGEGNGNPLRSSCLGNPTGRGAWWATVHGVAESDMTEPENTRCVYQEFIPFHCYCMIPMHHDPSVERH